MVRSLGNTSNDEAKASGWEILKPLNCEVVGKAILKDDVCAIMKSTKRFKVPGGWIYNTSTEYTTNAGVSIAEALCFVPEVEMVLAEKDN